MPRKLWVEEPKARSARGQLRAGGTSNASSEGRQQIRYEVGSAVSRRIPDAPIDRCVRCGGPRLIPLTFPGARRAEQFELPDRPSAKCVTCGCRYVGTQPVPAVESGLISPAERENANQSAPWGHALAEWALLMHSGRHQSSVQTQHSPDRTLATQSGVRAVRET
jgi:hypothetical protein